MPPESIFGGQKVACVPRIGIPRVCFPGLEPGVSSSIGRSANRGSLTVSERFESRQPFPMCSCRSIRLPQGFFESFRWNTRGDRDRQSDRSHERWRHILVRAQVVTRREEMTGIETHSNPRRRPCGRVSRPAVRIDNRDWFPGLQCARAISSRGSAAALRASRRLRGQLHQPLLFAAGRVGARVHDQPVQPEQLCAIQFFPERRNRLHAQ